MTGTTQPRTRSQHKRTRRRLRRALSILFAVLVASGLCTLVVLAGMSWHARAVAQDSITELSAKCDALGDEARLEVKRQAERYNETLANPATASAGSDGLWPYEQQLLFDREPMMSFVEIPTIAARLPIYHGTSEAALMAGVGHYEDSSLPIGGATSHCVLMGHSGMHGATMFDRLGELQPGDVFVIWTLSEPYAYRVMESEVVEPATVASLRVQAGRDLVTLVTCTPYGVNSHRLLVHAERCEYVPSEAEMPLVAIDERDGMLLAALAACMAAALLAAAGALVRRRTTKHRQP